MLFGNDASQTTHQRHGYLFEGGDSAQISSQVSSPNNATSSSSAIAVELSPQHTGLKFPSSPTASSIKNRDHQFGQQFMIALTIAGMCSSLLSTIFSLFHVDIFLRVYRLPLHAYSVGSLIFSVVNTANDLMGAWLLDAAATKMNRSDLIGISGCIFALCFL